MSPLHHAYLLKGWLLDKSPPESVNEALEAIIGVLADRPLDSPPATVEKPDDSLPGATDIEQDADPDADSDQHPEAPPPAAPEAKKKRQWSPEAKAAAAERMRKAREAKAAKKATEQVAPSVASPSTPAQPAKPVKIETDRLLTVHNAYAGKRDPGQPLTDDDWPDLKARLSKTPDRRAIASDYDVDLDDLNAFIDRSQRREGKSPGEALASPSGGASGAARPRW